MSVLSRPVRHHATAPTQRTAEVPLQREDTTSTSAPIAPRTPARPSARPTTAPERSGMRPTFLVAGVLAALAVAGSTTYVLLDDGGGTAATPTTSVDVPAPNAADLARDRAAAERGNDAERATDAQRDASLRQRQGQGALE